MQTSGADPKQNAQTPRLGAGSEYEGFSVQICARRSARADLRHAGLGPHTRGRRQFNDFDTVKKNIEDRLNPEFQGRFKIMLVPNITNICYGRGVGYKIEEIVLSEEIQKISATKIRAKMREEGKLK